MGKNRLALLGVALAVAVPFASTASEWRVERGQSALDGQSISATTRIVNPYNLSAFEVRLTCLQDSGDVQMTVEAFTEQRGLLHRDMIHVDVFTGPIGRVKRNGQPVQPLNDLFQTLPTSTSMIQLRSFNQLFDKFLSFNKQQMDEGTIQINRARSIAEMLPMALEATNSIGTSELVVEPSPQAMQVLNACGAQTPSYTYAEYQEIFSRNVELERAQNRERHRQLEEARQRAQGQREVSNTQTMQARYVDAIRTSIRQNWKRPSSVATGQTCDLNIRSLPGGQVVSVSVADHCDFNASERRTLEAAVLRAQPLPYVGFESVAQRNMVIRFTAE